MYIINDKYPLIKGKNFSPAPISKNGLPEYADSRSNPNVIGTHAYNEFWEEQIYRIINGYQTGGVFIPGRLYYFLNFGHVASVKGGSDYPNYVDLGLEYCELIVEAKRLRKNIIIPKARRKGLSVMTDIMVIDYGWRFSYNYQGGIIAGKKEYADDFIDKWLLHNKLIVPEFQTSIKTHDDSAGEILAGYEERQLNNAFQTQGTANMIYYKTAGSSESIMKGKYLMDLVYEESGEFDNLIETHNASKDCLMHGNIQYGTAYWYGTGGNMLKGSKDFKKIWNEPDAYNAIRFPVLAPRYFEPCVAESKDELGNVNEDIPNLQQFKEYQRIGMEDTKHAEELILAKRAELILAHDKKPYHDYCQNNPLSVEEIFQNSAVNNFDPDVLNKQMAIIDSELPARRYGKYKLKYVTNDKGELIKPLQVVAEPASELDEEKDCVLLLEAVPKKGYRNLYIGGGDSYDQDQARESKSLGAFVIVKQLHFIKSEDEMLPVAIIRNRPKRKEMFYELCMKLSIMFDLVQNTMFDAAKPAVIQYYKDKGCERYLSPRPRKFESENSEQTHDYGVLLTTFSRPRMESLLQSYFLDHCHKIWFPQILEEALSYDEGNNENDLDLIDALGCALMRITDMKYGVVDENNTERDKMNEMPVWGHDAEGNLIDKTSNYIVDDSMPDDFKTILRIQSSGD